MAILDSKREFIAEDGTTYYIEDPNSEDIKNADWMYSKIYTKSLMDGISTSSEMLDILTKRGIIGPEYEKRATELTESLRTAINELEVVTDTDDKYVAAMRVAEARDDLFRWNQRFSGPMAHTCEQLADDARLEYLTSTMVRNEGNSKMWPTYEDYSNTPNQSLARQSRVEVMLYLQGVSSNFMNETPEALAVREVEKSLADKFEKENELEAALEMEQVELNKNEAKETKAKKTPKKKTSTKTKKTTTKKVTKKEDD